jgi:hypothetical protein
MHTYTEQSMPQEKNFFLGRTFFPKEKLLQSEEKLFLIVKYLIL